MKVSGYGLNVVGYHRQALGIGAEARRVVRCLRAAGISVATIDAPGSSSEVLNELPKSDNEWLFEDTLSIIAGDQLRNCMVSLGSEKFERGMHASMWYWELMQINEAMRAALPLVDRLVAGSKFVQKCLVQDTDKRVYHFPLTDLNVYTATKKREELGLPSDRMIVLCTFDFFSVIERKNPLDAIKAFRNAFSENEGPILVVKSQNGHHLPSDLQAVETAMDGRSDIVLIDQHVDEITQASYLQCADILLTLHRSEGLGLHVFEALLRGVPVVSTSYSAPTEFLTSSNSKLVDFTLVPVSQGNGVYPVGYLWAQPDVVHAAHLLRKLWLESSELEYLKEGTDKVRRHLVSDSDAGQDFASWLTD